MTTTAFGAATNLTFFPKTAHGDTITTRPPGLLNISRLLEPKPQPDVTPPSVAFHPDPISPTIFHEPWWLQIASRGEYQEVIAESGGRLAGRLPYVVQRKLRSFNLIRIPDLTHCLGPALTPEFNPEGAVKSSKQIGVIGDLLAQLPKAAHVWFRLHPQMGNTLAFERAGYTCTTQWSVEIAPRKKDELWKQMRDKTRNAIRRASDILTVETPHDRGFFLDFYKQSLSDAGRSNNYDDETLRQLIPEAIRRNQGRVLAAMAADGTPQAAIFTVWNQDREFYFMSSRSPEAHFGAVNLLIWHAMQAAAAAGRIFDMDNIHVVNGNLPNLLLLSGFGGEIVPRYCVSKTAPFMAVAKTLGQALRR